MSPREGRGGVSYGEGGMSVALSACPSVPIFPHQRTSTQLPGWSVSCPISDMLLFKKQSSMRPGERRSRKANPELLDKVGDAAQVHIKI